MKSALAVVLLCCSSLAQMPLGGITGTSVSTQVLSLPIPVGSITVANRFSNWQLLNSTTEANTQLGSPVSGTITALYCSAQTAPSGGNNVISLRKAGVTVASCTIANGAHNGNSTGLSVAVTEGDLIGSDVTTLTTASQMSLSARVEGVPLGVAVIPLGFGAAVGTGTSRAFSVKGASTTFSSQAVPSPISGTLSALYVGTDVTAGASQVFTFCDITKSSTCVSTGVVGTCTMSGKNTACTGLSGSVTEGNLIAGMVNNTSGSTANFGGYAKITGVTANVSVLAFGTSTLSTIAASGNAYYALAAVDATTESNIGLPAAVGGTAAGLYAGCNVTPAGAGHSSTLYLNDLSSSLTCASGANQNCTDTSHTATITRGQNTSLNSANSNTTTAANCGGYVKVTGTI